jgi:hypothetical protein
MCWDEYLFHFYIEGFLVSRLHLKSQSPELLREQKAGLTNSNNSKTNQVFKCTLKTVEHNNCIPIRNNKEESEDTYRVK